MNLALLALPLVLGLMAGKRRPAPVGNAALVDDEPDYESDGGEDPLDWAYEVTCEYCGIKGTFYLRDAKRMGSKKRLRTNQWIRTAPGWTVLLPFYAGHDDQTVRCPQHGAWPRPPRWEGPPPPPHMVVKPGWYWYWVQPAEQGEWEDLMNRWSTMAFVLHVRKTWGSELGFLGEFVLFEVIGSDLIWTLRSRPRPAPKGADTTLLDIVSSDPNPIAGWAQDEFQRELERLRNPPPNEPFPWPWKGEQ